MKTMAARSDRPEMLAMALLILACNVSLLFGMPAAWLSFNAGAVAVGQWWRIVTHPFVHVSLYHLFVDGLAFMVLYSALAPVGSSKRLAVLLATGIGSLAGAWSTMAQYGARAFCGLSGVGHGLMAAYALLLVHRGIDRAAVRAGYLSLALVVVKSIVECVSGNVVFASLHLGSVGIPIPACHAGGVIGGLSAMYVCGHPPARR